jgi:parallel beta-helix repeat protein
MRRNFTNRVYPALLFLLLFPFLSGCQLGFNKIFSSAADTEKVAIDNSMPEHRDTQLETPVREKTAPEPALSYEEKILSQIINLQNPESLTPLTSQAQSHLRNSTAADVGETRRSELGRDAVDISYRDALLTEDTTWQGVVLIEGGVTIAPQATLTVSSGTIVRFRRGDGAEANAALLVQGRIVVNGTVDRPVLFTSTYGDVANGDWQGIVLTGSGKKNLVEHCRVEGAETGIDASYSTVTLKNVFFSRCRTGARFQDTLAVMGGVGAGECGAGLILFDSEADIRFLNIFGNQVGVFAARSSLSLAQSKFAGNNLLAMYLDSCRIIISGNSFTANGSALTLIGCEGSVSSNQVAKNSVFGIVLMRSRVKVSGNEIEGNGRVGLRTEDGKGVAWGNALFANGEYDLYNNGIEEFRAIGNWWGTAAAADIAARIFDRSRDESRGRVLYFPPLQKRPEIPLP